MKRLITLAASAAILSFSACKEKGEVSHFQFEKSTPTPAHQAPDTDDPPQQNTPNSWTLPEGWTPQPASGMRLATITIPTSSGTLNASITEFGGDLAGNVNRWRGQVGLPPLPEKDVLPSLEKVDTSLGQGYIASLTNPSSPEKAMLTAIIPRPSGTSVFIKVTGPSDALKSIATPFRQFTQSLKQ
jgi:hypothetical protein